MAVILKRNNARIIFSFTVLLLLELIQLSNESEQIYTNSYDKLELVVVVARHGDRTPLKTFKNTPSQWPEGLGELTALGMRQHFDLGQQYRKLYIEEHKFIAEKYNRSQFYAQSSGSFRTLMSADSFVLGFFPPGSGPKLGDDYSLPHGLQSIPIFSDSPDDDFLLLTHKLCPNVKKLRSELKKSDKWRKLTEENQHLFTELSTIMGEDISLAEIPSIIAITNAERYHSRPTIAEIAHNQTLFNHLKNLHQHAQN